jgi:hypothetical protein
MKTCPSCKTTNAADARFCGHCMAPLPPSAGKTCPAGRHTMEPAWTECAYCRSESASVGPPPIPASPGSGYVRRPTVVEDTGASALPAPSGTGTLQTPTPVYADDRPLPPRPTPRPFKPAPIPPQPPPLTSRPNIPPPSIPPPSPQPIPRKTVYRPEPAAAAPASSIPPPPVLAQRRIVGMLVTYSWKPDGEIFPIREGRNLIGRDPDCEVCISADQTMSGRNSHITFRTTFVVGDLVSMKGTDLNGDPIEQQFLSLPNYAVIRAGSTQFTFIAIQPASVPGADPLSGQANP